MENYILENREDALNGFSYFQKRANEYDLLKINGNIPILNVPGILKSNLVKKISYDCSVILLLIKKIVDTKFKEEGCLFFKRLGFTNDEISIFMKTYGDNTGLMSRCDIMIDLKTEKYKLLEFNVDSSVGGMEIAEVNKLMLSVPFYEKYLSNRKYSYTDPLLEFCLMIKNISREQSVKNIAIVDSDQWIDGYLWSLSTMKEALESHGFKVVVGSQKDLVYKDRSLKVKGKKVDLVYRVFLNDDIKNDYESINPIFEAFKNKDILLINGLHTELYSSKLLFALFYDEKYRKTFTEEEREIVDRVIPRTNVVDKESLQGIYSRKNSIVLKPVDGYGGKGIYLGWNFTDIEWVEIVNNILISNTTYIAQEKVNINYDYNYIINDDTIIRKDYLSTWGIYLFDDKFSGIMYRGMDVDSGEIVNAAQGAGMTATFIINDK